jgi:hypothetical protein
VANRLKSTNWTLDLSYCHRSLKEMLMPCTTAHQYSDFFVLTDIELGKLPLETFFKLVRKKYNDSKFGGYIAVLSYYLNTNVVRHDLQGSYSENIAQVFSENLSYVNRLENLSSVTDFPINKTKNNVLIEGSNFIFVHPNIRYFLWK